MADSKGRERSVWSATAGSAGSPLRTHGNSQVSSAPAGHLNDSKPENRKSIGITCFRIVGGAASFLASDAPADLPGKEAEELPGYTQFVRLRPRKETLSNTDLSTVAEQRRLLKLEDARWEDGGPESMHKTF